MVGFSPKRVSKGESTGQEVHLSQTFLIFSNQDAPKSLLPWKLPLRFHSILYYPFFYPKIVRMKAWAVKRQVQNMDPGKYTKKKNYILEQTLLPWTGTRSIPAISYNYGPKWFPSPIRGGRRGGLDRMLIFYVAINTFRSLFRAADSCGSFSFDKDCCQSLGFALRTFEKKSQLTSNFQNLSLS